MSEPTISILKRKNSFFRATSARLAATLLVLTLLGACSTKDTRFGSDADDSASQADPSAWGASVMMVRKYQKIRPANDYQFYFKHCSEDTARTFYSKTSYYCTAPF